MQKNDEIRDWIKKMEKDSDNTAAVAVIVFLVILCGGPIIGIGNGTSVFIGLIVALTIIIKGKKRT